MRHYKYLLIMTAEQLALAKDIEKRHKNSIEETIRMIKGEPDSPEDHLTTMALRAYLYRTIVDNPGSEALSKDIIEEDACAFSDGWNACRHVHNNSASRAIISRN